MLGLELAFGKWSMSFIVFQAGQSNDFTRSRRSPSPSCPRSMSEKRANHSTLVMKGSCCFSVFLVSALWTWYDKIVSYIFLAALHLTSEWLPLVAVLFLFCSSAFSFFICIFPFLFSFLVLAFPFSPFLSFFSFPCPFPFRFLFHFWALFFWVQFKSFFEPVTLEFEL